MGHTLSEGHPVASGGDTLRPGRSPHFPVFAEFKNASYLERYDRLCQKLVQEQLYTTAGLITSKRSAATNGEFAEMSPMTGLKTFVTDRVAGHVAAEAARLG